MYRRRWAKFAAFGAARRTRPAAAPSAGIFADIGRRTPIRARRGRLPLSRSPAPSSPRRRARPRPAPRCDGGRCARQGAKRQGDKTRRRARPYSTGAPGQRRALPRPAEALEVVPGLTVSQHKRRGQGESVLVARLSARPRHRFRLPLDGMPLNMRTTAMGRVMATQFPNSRVYLAPSSAARARIMPTKGDFSSAGAAASQYLDKLPSTPLLRVTGGSFAYGRLLGVEGCGGEGRQSADRVESRHLQRPLVRPDEIRKINCVLRWSAALRRTAFAHRDGLRQSLVFDRPDSLARRKGGIIPLWGNMDRTDQRRHLPI